MKRILTIGITLILILTPVVSYLISPKVSETIPDTVEKFNLNPTAPIRINSNDDIEQFSKTMGPLDKSVGDVYVFEGLFIDGSAQGYCMYIGNTTKTIIVRNCTFQNSLTGIVSFPDNAALILYQAQNIVIENNSIFNNYDGIYLEKSYYNTISNNCIFNNTNGIEEKDSGINRITTNIIQSNSISGIEQTDSDSDMIRNNTFLDNEYGINTYHSSPTVIGSAFRNNTYGIYMQYSGTAIEDCNFEHNVYGTYHIGNVLENNAHLFDFGKEERIFTSVGGVHDFLTSISMPRNAIIRTASMNLEIQPITDEVLNVDYTMQMLPVIQNNIVVWQDYMDNSWDIFAYDLSMDSDGNGVPNYLEIPPPEPDMALNRITRDSAMQICPSFDGSTIVWTNINNSNYDIYAYSFKNKTVWPVCTDSSIQRNPAVSGDRVVWEDFRDGNYNIYMLNITKGEVSRLSTSSRHDMAPEIDGNYVVWHSYSGSPGTKEYSDIVLFDLNEWALNYINKDDPLQYDPDISGNNIVWHDQRNGNWEIYSYDILTKTEKRLTYEKEQSFCPRIDKDNVVYYYHDRYLDTWSVRAYDMDTDKQTIVDDNTYCDSHPDTWGRKMVWVSRVNQESRIHVMDYEITGAPKDVKVDIGGDGAYELEIPDGSVNEICLNGSEFIDAIRKEMASPDFGGVIPVELYFNNTGRIVLSNLSILYDLPTIVESSFFNDSAETAVCVLASSPTISNTSLNGNNHDVMIMSNSVPIFRNTSYSESLLYFNDEIGKLLVQNFLYIRVENISGFPLNATASISTNHKILFNNSIGADGIAGSFIIDFAQYFKNGKITNKTEINVSYDGHYFDNNNRVVNMSKSHWEYFITDILKPQVSLPYPAPGQYYIEINPVISIHIIDNNNIDISTVKLYIQDFAVYYESEVISSGYNISYKHPVAYGNDKEIQCRIVGEDFHHNNIEYSWEFKIDRQAVTFSRELELGWNLVSMPLALYNNSVESAFGSIAGCYDRILTYDSVNGVGTWEKYMVNLPGERNGFNDISSAKGYWINITESCTLSINGKSESMNIPLYSGWNLVGYPSMSMNKTLADALWGTGADRVEVFDSLSPYLLRIAEPNQTMLPGLGYWVHVPADTVWVP